MYTCKETQENFIHSLYRKIPNKTVKEIMHKLSLPMENKSIFFFFFFANTVFYSFVDDKFCRRISNFVILVNECTMYGTRNCTANAKCTPSNVHEYIIRFAYTKSVKLLLVTICNGCTCVCVCVCTVQVHTHTHTHNKVNKRFTMKKKWNDYATRCWLDTLCMSM